jgi:hypothetical protein
MIATDINNLSKEEMVQVDFIADSWRNNIAINRDNYSQMVINAAYQLAISTYEQRTNFKNQLSKMKGI